MSNSELNKDPLEQFKHWYEEAKKTNEADPEAMALATATPSGRPSVRVVLYKGISQGGFMIYTNYGSRKAQELIENPYAALMVYWPASYRQIRIEGRVEKVSVEESERYFQTRSRDSQLGALASPQSREIQDRSELLGRFNELEMEYEDKEIPCPEFWGGFRVIPDEIEFWQGMQHRLHDRFCYRRENNNWKVIRLAP